MGFEVGSRCGDQIEYIALIGFPLTLFLKKFHGCAQLLLAVELDLRLSPLLFRAIERSSCRGEENMYVDRCNQQIGKTSASLQRPIVDISGNLEIAEWPDV